MTRAKITGTGMFVPERVVTNDDLSTLMDTSDEWIRQRTGIEARRWVQLRGFYSSLCSAIMPGCLYGSCRCFLCSILRYPQL